MSEILRLSQKQESAVFELFDDYKKEYKQDPAHLAKVLNEVNAERTRTGPTREDQYHISPANPAANPISEYSAAVGYNLGSFLKHSMSESQHQQVARWYEQHMPFYHAQPNPFRMARMDREASLIELSIAAVKIDNNDALSAKILVDDAKTKMQ